MKKKTIRVTCGMPMYIQGCKVPWEDIHLRFSIGRKKVTWYPCIIGSYSLANDIGLNNRLLANDNVEQDRKDSIRIEVELYESIIKSKKPYWMEGNRADGAWDNIFYPSSDFLDKKDLEGAIAFGLKERYEITTPLRFRWDRVPGNNYIQPV